mgnify:CR=1 FL=1|jgi:hypothetical protein
MKEKYTHKKLEYIGEKVINWCVDKFGLSKHYNDYPYVEIDMVETNNPLGEFISDNNEIIIYPKAINNMDEFIGTIIHEYTHYMQSPSWYTRYLNNLTIDEVIKNLPSPSHPYEIEADEVAKKNMNKCKNEVLNDK